MMRQRTGNTRGDIKLHGSLQNADGSGVGELVLTLLVSIEVDVGVGLLELRVML